MTSALQIYAADTGEGTAKGQITLKDTAAYNQTPTGGIVFQGHHTAGAQAIFAGIRGFKANTGDGDYDGCLAFDVRKHGAVAYEAMRINEDGNVNIKGGNLSVGLDSATVDFTDSNSNTKFIEIGADGGDALLVTHTAGAGVGYFGYHLLHGDRLVVACDNGSGSNKIDFIVNAGTTTGGGTDNLNNVSAISYNFWWRFTSWWTNCLHL